MCGEIVKKGLVFQILITLILLVSWNLIHLGFEYQKEDFFEKASKIEMIIFAEDFGDLQELKRDLQQVYYIDRVEVVSDTTVADELIATYDLGNVSDILVSYNLPNIMSINFDGRTFREAEKIEFEQFLKEKYPKLNVNFDDEIWLKNEKDLLFIKKSYQVANIIIFLLLLFIVNFLRIHFEIKHNEFWHIFRSAGGKYNRRTIEFLKDSFILCLIPIALVVAVYYFLIFKGYLIYEIDYRIFIIELAALILSALISRITLWSKF